MNVQQQIFDAYSEWVQVQQYKQMYRNEGGMWWPRQQYKQMYRNEGGMWWPGQQLLTAA